LVAVARQQVFQQLARRVAGFFAVVLVPVATAAPIGILTLWRLLLLLLHRFGGGGGALSSFVGLIKKNIA